MVSSIWKNYLEVADPSSNVYVWGSIIFRTDCIGECSKRIQHLWASYLCCFLSYCYNFTWLLFIKIELAAKQHCGGHSTIEEYSRSWNKELGLTHLKEKNNSSKLQLSKIQILNMTFTIYLILHHKCVSLIKYCLRAYPKSQLASC